MKALTDKNSNLYIAMVMYVINSEYHLVINCIGIIFNLNFGVVLKSIIGSF